VALFAKYCPFHRHTPCRYAISSTETAENAFKKAYGETHVNQVVIMNNKLKRMWKEVVMA
jgi:hypothetical protein